MPVPPDSPPGGWGYAKKRTEPIDPPLPRIPGVIVIDLRPLTRMLARMNRGFQQPSVKRIVRIEADSRYIRRVADRERAAARAWLDQHMDEMYADLGLERYPNIPF